MPAATANRDAARKGRDSGEQLAYAVKASTVIYKGSFVSSDATTGGLARPTTKVASDNILGVASAKADNSAGAAGAINVLVEKEGSFAFPLTGGGATTALLGAPLYADGDAGVTTVATGATLCGYVSGIIDGSNVYCRIDNAVH